MTPKAALQRALEITETLSAAGDTLDRIAVLRAVLRQGLAAADNDTTEEDDGK